MKSKLLLTPIALLGSALLVSAANYHISVVASGLHWPRGIVALDDDIVFFSQVPTPGVPGSRGGSNTVDALDIPSGERLTIATGEPEPTFLALNKQHQLFWTCKSAGVIATTDFEHGITVLLSGLNHPSGIAVDRWNNIYFTTLPTPGLPASMGGSNTVEVFDGTSSTVLEFGNPEPTAVTVDRLGNAYWTCKSAGVILKRDATGTITHLLTGLHKPTGIALDHLAQNLFFTEVPTPGIPGSSGGQNKVWRLNLVSMDLTLVHGGDPEPFSVTVAPGGAVFWTCSSAGVIVEAQPVDEGEDE
jgi:DNA-binding beta-propeller fold protein YncE